MTVELPDLLRSIEGGLAYRVFDQFVEHTGLTPGAGRRVRRHQPAHAGDPPWTRAASRGTSPIGSSARRVSSAARSRSSAVIEPPPAAWLTSGQPTLGGSIPLELARTDLGAREVEAAIASSEAGPSLTSLTYLAYLTYLTYPTYPTYPTSRRTRRLPV